MLFGVECFEMVNRGGFCRFCLYGWGGRVIIFVGVE